MAEERGDFRRLPAVPRTISEISPTDIRVCFIGRVAKIDGDKVLIDDGVKSVEIETNSSLKEGGLVRVFARVMPGSDGFGLQVEIVQPMEGLDMGLYNKVREIEKLINP